MSKKPIGEVLDAFDAALAGPEPAYEPLFGAARDSWCRRTSRRAISPQKRTKPS